MGAKSIIFDIFYLIVFISPFENCRTKNRFILKQIEICIP